MYYWTREEASHQREQRAKNVDYIEPKSPDPLLQLLVKYTPRELAEMQMDDFQRLKRAAEVRTLQTTKPASVEVSTRELQLLTDNHAQTCFSVSFLQGNGSRSQCSRRQALSPAIVGCASADGVRNFPGKARLVEPNKLKSA
jgi:hypothetical protein